MRLAGVRRHPARHQLHVLLCKDKNPIWLLFQSRRWTIFACSSMLAEISGIFNGRCVGRFKIKSVRLSNGDLNSESEHGRRAASKADVQAHEVTMASGTMMLASRSSLLIVRVAPLRSACCIATCTRVHPIAASRMRSACRAMGRMPSTRNPHTSFMEAMHAIVAWTLLNVSLERQTNSLQLFLQGGLDPEKWTAPKPIP